MTGTYQQKFKKLMKTADEVIAKIHAHLEHLKDKEDPNNSIATTENAADVPSQSFTMKLRNKIEELSAVLSKESTNTIDSASQSTIEPPVNLRSREMKTFRRKNQMCSICLEVYTKRMPVATYCGHVFCHDCIHRAIRRTKKCPMCNRALTCYDIFRIYL